MNYNILNQKGFIHLKDVLNVKKIKQIQKYINNINFKHMIFYDEYILKNKKWQIDISNQGFKPITFFLKRGDNNNNKFINKHNRTILQFYYLNNVKLKNKIIKYKNEPKRGYKVRDNCSDYLDNYYIQNLSFFNNLFKNSILDNYFKDYALLEIKYFINKPDCIEQEIHIDEVDPLNICVTIPLNFNEKFGTTIIYDNEIVNKYKKDKNRKQLINFGNKKKNINEEYLNDFFKAEYKENLNIGDILIFKGDTFHKGSKNLSQETRYFLHLRYQKKIKLNFDTNYNLLNQKGFIHFKNIFDINEVNNYSKYIKSIDYNKKIKYNNISYTNQIINIKPMFISLKNYLLGHNHFISNKNRYVIQLYAITFNQRLTKPFIHYNQINIPTNKRIRSLIFENERPSIYNINMTNLQLLTKLINNSILSELLNEYYIMSIKYFINKPNSNEQEIHCDEPKNTYGEQIICIIPLNYNSNGGTTAFYNNEFVNKYKNISNKQKLYNIGHFDNLSKNIKKDFLNAEYKHIFNIGDCILFKGDTFHNATKNKSNYNREFLYIVLIKKKKKITLHNNFFQ